MPSVISAPILRPLRVAGAFLMRRAPEKLKIDGLTRRRDLVGLGPACPAPLDGLPRFFSMINEMAQHALANRDGLDLAELEGEGADDMALLPAPRGSGTEAAPGCS